MTQSAPDLTTVPLASEQDAHSREEWERAAAAVLRKMRRMTDEQPDADVWAGLARQTLDALTVTPLGIREDVAGADLVSPVARVGDWDNRVAVLGADAEALCADLANGADSLWLAADPGTDLAARLAGVPLDLAAVVLEAPEAPLTTAEALLALARERGEALHPASNLGADPVGARLRAGAGSSAGGDELVDVARLAAEAGVLGVVVDATALHDLGASDAQELGYSLAVGAAYLRALTASGFDVDTAAGLLEFRYAATVEQFPTIAKLRAARHCWARLAQLSGAGPEAQGQRQHAVTSRPMTSAYDPYVNMLRGTVAAFAAGVAGAEAVTVLPFDLPLGEPDAFGRRIARNVSSLLLAEAHVGAVSDPAAGAFAVERLTRDLAEAAWAELGRIEEAGGVEAALTDGSLLARVDTVVAERDRQVARRERPLTGVSEFPLLGEVRPERTGTPDGVRRYGAAFEALRDEPVPTPVFLATMGTVAAHTARATFATNLLAAGGVAVESAGATSGPADVLAAYTGQSVVCLAGPDQAYAEWGTELVSALREAGATRVILAGKPGDRTVAAGAVDDSCALGVDALAFLDRTRRALAGEVVA